MRAPPTRSLKLFSLRSHYGVESSLRPARLRCSRTVLGVLRTQANASPGHRRLMSSRAGRRIDRPTRRATLPDQGFVVSTAIRRDVVVRGHVLQELPSGLHLRDPMTEASQLLVDHLPPLAAPRGASEHLADVVEAHQGGLLPVPD